MLSSYAEALLGILRTLSSSCKALQTSREMLFTCASVV